MLLSAGEEASTQWLRSQIEDTETRIDKNDQILRHVEEGDDSCSVHGTPIGHLTQIAESLASLELERALSDWHSSSDGSDSLQYDTLRCERLGELLLKQDSAFATKSLLSVLHGEYLPLFKYVRSGLILRLRQSLRRNQFPSKKSIQNLGQQSRGFKAGDGSAVDACYWMTRLQVQADLVFERLRISSHPDVETKQLDVVVELCRPIVENVSFHFLQVANDRVTSTKIDRLPEWLLNYTRETVLEGGVWDFIAEDLAPHCMHGESMKEQFLQEILGVVQFVLVQRGFFRHSKIAGPQSNPLLLMGAIEQLLTFDSLVKDLFPGSDKQPSLTKNLVADDSSLWKWWMNRERESAVSALFDTTVDNADISHRVSPRAELFCALISSIRTKASLLRKSALPFVAGVAVPLCQEFLDAIHESATDLRSLLGQRNFQGTGDLKLNIDEWIRLINGTNMASRLLLGGNDGNPGSTADNDLARVGRSLERMRDALVDECAKTFVETVLMERAKLASYIMRCSHTLSTPDPDEFHHGISADLQETATLYKAVMSVCTTEPKVNAEPDDKDAIDGFAPLAIKCNVTDRLAEKFLEVALDAHAMTPEIVLFGAKQFATDMIELFGVGQLPPIGMRLRDVSNFMALETKPYNDLRSAFQALIDLPTEDGETARFRIDDFLRDGTVAEQAGSMVAAKGFTWLSLEDVLSVFNRRNQ